MTDVAKAGALRNDRKRLSSPDVDDVPLKRAKTEGKDESKKSVKANPYLAHWNTGYDDMASSDFKPKRDPLANFERRKTTAKQAFEAENSDHNPFTGEPHSQQYFNILKTRRNLPVHQQR